MPYNYANFQLADTCLLTVRGDGKVVNQVWGTTYIDNIFLLPDKTIAQLLVLFLHLSTTVLDERHLDMGIDVGNIQRRENTEVFRHILQELPRRVPVKPGVITVETKTEQLDSNDVVNNFEQRVNNVVDIINNMETGELDSDDVIYLCAGLSLSKNVSDSHVDMIDEVVSRAGNVYPRRSYHIFYYCYIIDNINIVRFYVDYMSEMIEEGITQFILGYNVPVTRERYDNIIRVATCLQLTHLPDSEAFNYTAVDLNKPRCSDNPNMMFSPWRHVGCERWKTVVKNMFNFDVINKFISFGGLDLAPSAGAYLMKMLTVDKFEILRPFMNERLRLATESPEAFGHKSSYESLMTVDECEKYNGLINIRHGLMYLATYYRTEIMSIVFALEATGNTQASEDVMFLIEDKREKPLIKTIEYKALLDKLLEWVEGEYYPLTMFFNIEGVDVNEV